jgi:predicted negative regulator of RcsB-dependent stress response
LLKEDIGVEVYRTDEERIEVIKAWWEKNGKFLIVAVIVIVSTVVGSRVWMNFKQAEAGRVSAQYDLMLEEMDASKADSALQRGAAIVEQNSGTEYAVLAALAMAKIEVEKNDLNSARLHLQWAIDHASLDEIKHVARLRLARVQLADGKLDEALSLATTADTGAFAGEYDFLRGEVYAAKGQAEQARTAYEAAMKSETLGGQTKSIIRLKLDDLGEAKS